MRALIVATICLAVARPAHADDVDDLVAQGEELGKQAEWSRAIDAFKAADAKHPRAKHACLIGLAYTRRELWAEAELFLSICRQRATADDPAPEWAQDAQQQLTAKLAASNAAPVTIAVHPHEAVASVSVSSFAPGETFTPRTIHLAPGTHVITVTATGYKTVKREITITEHNFPTDVAVHLEEVHPPPPPSVMPWIVMAGGGALLLGGLAYDHWVFQPAADDLGNNGTAFDYYTNLGAVETKQHVVIGMIGVGAAAVVTGAVLRLTVFRTTEAVSVAALPQRGGGIVTIGWSR